MVGILRNFIIPIFSENESEDISLGLCDCASVRLTSQQLVLCPLRPCSKTSSESLYDINGYSQPAKGGEFKTSSCRVPL